MLRRLGLAAVAVTALTAVLPQAHAYRTTMCEDNGFPREIGVGESSRVVFVGVEQSTPLVGPVVGARLCFEVNDGASNVAGYDLGIGVFYDLAGRLVVDAWVCGVPAEASCVHALSPTGVRVGTGDLPSAGTASGCIATVGTTCVGSPSVTYGGDAGTATITLWVNGTAIPVDVSRNCVSVPPTTC
ncbi:MAG TPA: hypothetical protein VGX28_06835 [Frankiaceae bacterium]|jgi:hypothetical protein|nr:hypothetical protein [Frankiaceae bacterium]